MTANTISPAAAIAKVELWQRFFKKTLLSCLTTCKSKTDTTTQLRAQAECVDSEYLGPTADLLICLSADKPGFQDRYLFFNNTTT